MGRDKVLEYIGNESLLQRVVSKLETFGSEIIIVAADGQSFSQFADHPKVSIETDIYPGRGSLVGLYTGLVASTSFYNVVVACDMPFLNRALLRYMAQLSTGVDAVVPRLGKMVEPLHAVYSRGCLTTIERLLEEGNLAVRDILPLIKVRYVETEEIDMFDPTHLSFFNINTEADLEKARELVKGEVSDAEC